MGTGTQHALRDHVLSSVDPFILSLRVYINYYDMNAANVGWNGSTFA